MDRSPFELLSLANDFQVTKKDYGYIIEPKSWDAEKYQPVAILDDDEGLIRYYLAGCYNSGSDHNEIDIETLSKLMKFCNMLKGETK